MRSYKTHSRRDRSLVYTQLGKTSVDEILDLSLVFLFCFMSIVIVRYTWSCCGHLNALYSFDQTALERRGWITWPAPVASWLNRVGICNLDVLV